MAAIASFPLTDTQSTPVVHTFTPTLNEGRMSVWKDKANAVVKSWPTITMSHTVDDEKSEVVRIKISIAMPTMEALSSASSGITPGPTLAYVNRFNSEFIISRRATLQERKDLRSYSKDIMALTMFLNAVETFEVPY